MCCRFLVVIIIPIALSAISLLNDLQVTRWLYVVSIMTVFWLTETIPYSITSIMPIGLFPLLGIMPTAEICSLYAHETVFTFLGSLIIATSIEACNLHKRIALKILCHVKCYHRRLQFVAMAVTMFISMWMPNFFVVAMMSAIFMVILQQFEAQGTTALYKPVQEDSGALLRPSSLTTCYMLGISYAATLGGCGSLLGTPTNLAFKGIFETYFPGREIYLPKFFLYGAPVVLLNTLLTWLWLQFLLMGLLRSKSNVTEEVATKIKETITQKYNEMGGWSAKEIQVAVVLVMFHVVLFSRPFWANALTNAVVKDASPTIVFVILLFILPSKSNCCTCCGRSSDQSPSLLVWTCVRSKIPWGLVFLLGAGIALAASGKKLQISIKIGELIGHKIEFPSLAISFVVCLTCQIFTEFLSNTAAASIMLPFLAAFCTNEHFVGDAIDLMFPAALSLSMAFHSSIGTPGNAYVAGLVNIPAKEIFYCGIGPSMITLLTYWSTFPTYGRLIDKHIRMPNNNATSGSNTTAT